MIKLVLCDFDGTLVKNDILDELCRISGNYNKSRRLNQRFIEGNQYYNSPLKERINLLEGVTISQIEAFLSHNVFLVEGTGDFFRYLKKNNIYSVVHSGNIEPVLQHFQRQLHFDEYIATKIKISERGTIVKLDDNITCFKENSCKSIISKLNIDKDEIVAIGDSIADVKVFELAGYSIAINAKGSIEDYASYAVKGNMYNVLEVVESLMDSEN